MRFSFILSPEFTWEETLGLYQQAEAVGFDRVLYGDHILPMGDDIDGPVSEGWTMLAAVAATVPRLRVGTSVTCNGFRNPALLAKMAATVDRISGGRLSLGLGAGWYGLEHTAYGFDFPTPGERFGRLEESIQIIQSMFANRRTTFQGRYYQVTDAPLDPKPIQSPVPIFIGARLPRGMRLAARYAQEWNTTNFAWLADAETNAKPEVMRLFEQACADEGRDLASIERSTLVFFAFADDPGAMGQAEFYRKHRGQSAVVGDSNALCRVVERVEAAGFSQICACSVTLGADYDGIRKGMERFMKEVGSRFS
jgi:alkanesulfonate monooxygenase SsuD/methylene tetrahydromethanopterin reductase-like flavin-dependent oxidoreductase (luciferase family)